MEKYLAQKIKLGLFVISATILFILGVYLVGSKKSMFGDSSTVFVTFDNINGLRNGNNVRFSGINIGTVKELKMISDTLIVVKISLDQDVFKHIKSDALCNIGSDGLVGSKIIDIVPGGYQGVSLQDGDTLKSVKSIRTAEILKTLSNTNNNVELVTEELLQLLKEINTGQGLIGALIKDEKMTEDINELIANLKFTSKASTNMVTKLNNIIDGLNNNNNSFIGLLRDTASVSSIKNTITNTEKVSKELEIVLDNLNATIYTANQTIKNMKDGKGAINYLSNDEDLTIKIGTTIEHLDTTVIQINKAGIKLNENLEALKSTWLLRGYFKKVEKQKKN